MMSPNLVLAAKRGDEHAFSLIVDNISYDSDGNNKLKRFALKNNYIESEEDLVQEFKLKIWVAIQKYDESKNRHNNYNVEGLAWTMIRNWMVDQKRKHFGLRENTSYNNSYEHFDFEESSKNDNMCVCDFENLDFNLSMQQLQGTSWKVANMLCMGFTKEQTRQRLKLNKRSIEIGLKRIKKSLCLN